jgi:peptide chain release factor 3
VLTAVDSALMVIDAANGVEAQTRRLIEVCRQRDTPIITFVNKMDREVRDPLDILDEVERELGMPCVPMTWPVGQGKSFGGIINLRTQAMTVFDSGSERLPQDFETIPLTEQAQLAERFGWNGKPPWTAWSWPPAHRPRLTKRPSWRANKRPCSLAPA